MSRERLSRGETLAWSVAGFGAGIVGGLWMARWLGRVTRDSLAGQVLAVRHGAGATTVTLAERVRRALVADPALSAHPLGVLAVSRGTVELVGWVPDRSTRAHAFRTANQVRGLDGVINSILVHGEDDLPEAAGAQHPRGTA